MLALLPSIITALVPLAPTLVSVIKNKRRPKGLTEAFQFGVGAALVTIYTQATECSAELTLSSLSCVSEASWVSLASALAALAYRAVAKGKDVKGGE